MKYTERELIALSRVYASKRELGTCEHERPEECPHCDDMEAQPVHRLLETIIELQERLSR